MEIRLHTYFNFIWIKLRKIWPIDTIESVKYIVFTANGPKKKVIALILHIHNDSYGTVLLTFYFALDFFYVFFFLH